MAGNDRLSPCAADALSGIHPVTVRGKTVSINGLCNAVAAVQAKNLNGDNQITTALLEEVEKCNYIPLALRDKCGAVLLQEYRAIRKNASQILKR